MFRPLLPLFSRIAGFRHPRKKEMGIALCVLSMLTLLWFASTPAQAQNGGWSEPYRLSSEAGKASEASLVSDPYGFVHSFWIETLFADERQIIQYARFDGATWSPPNAIYVTGREIRNLSPFIDQQGTLYMAWTEGLTGPAYYTYAPAHNAQSSRSWARPLRIDIPAGIIRFLVDSKGVFHILYINRGEDLGVYYVRSVDQGQTWSEPLWLDPDILPNHIPDSLNFDRDEDDGLHAVWFYGAGASTANPDWVRYAHSLDGGNRWSSPFTIDQANEADDYELTNASPKMIVQGKTVHVIWAAGDLPYRHHRFSTDAGQSWSPRSAVFGNLHGQAFDGLTVDGIGRVHFVGQIRYPVAIYHAFWDQTQWTSPSLVYMIAPEGAETEGRIHAHDTTPILRAGNQLVITFGDGPSDPNRRLFAMYRTLDDLAPLPLVPTPALTDASAPLPSPSPTLPTPFPTPTTNALLFNSGTQPSGYIPGPDVGIQMGLIPTVLLIGGTVVIRLWYNRRR
jgi:hypothetical protein